jgi:hypothetical protein
VDLLDALLARGVLRTKALQLLCNKSGDELTTLRGWIEYWDRIDGQKGPGLLIKLITSGDGLPPSFETSRLREVRRSEQERKARRREARAALERAYSEHIEREIDRYIDDQLTPGEYEQLLEKYRVDLTAEGFFADLAKRQPTALDSTLRRLARAEIRQRLTTVPSFAEFCGVQGTEILSRFGVELVELRIHQVEEAETGGADPSPGARSQGESSSKDFSMEAAASMLEPPHTDGSSESLST